MAKIHIGDGTLKPGGIDPARALAKGLISGGITPEMKSKQDSMMENKVWKVLAVLQREVQIICLKNLMTTILTTGI